MPEDFSPAQALSELRAAIKPLRGLLEMETLFDKALAAERVLVDSADAVAKANRAQVDAEAALAKVRDEIAASCRESDRVQAEARAKADAIVKNGEAQAFNALADAKAAIEADAAKNAEEREAWAKTLNEIGSEVGVLTSKRDALHAELAEMTDAVASEQAKLAAIRSAIAAATKV